MQIIPALLSRASRLSADISYFLGLQDDDQTWKATSLHKKLLTSPQLQQYISRLTSLDSGSDLSRLLAHSYVRYMGDLSGGQMNKYKLQKAWELEQEKRGLTFYDFGFNGEIGSVGELKKIEGWFRVGMDNGIGQDIAMKEALIDEVNYAFELNTSIFAVLAPKNVAAKEADPTPSTTAVSTKLAESGSGVSTGSTIAFVFILGLIWSVFLIGGKGYSEFAQTWLPGLISHFD